jgi:hypothetical protein
MERDNEEAPIQLLAVGRRRSVFGVSRRVYHRSGDVSGGSGTVEVVSLALLEISFA